MILSFSLNTVSFNQYHEDLYIGDAAKMAVKTQTVVRVNVPLASYILRQLIPKTGYFPKHSSNISVTGICCRRRQDQPLISQNQLNCAHAVRMGKGNRKKV